MIQFICNLFISPLVLLNEGDKIEITWLPNPRNHPTTRSCYIGMSGVVCNLDSEGFALEGETSVLIVHKKFRFKRIK